MRIFWDTEFVPAAIVVADVLSAVASVRLGANNWNKSASSAAAVLKGEKRGSGNFPLNYQH